MSADAGNIAILGSDSLIYVPAPTGGVVVETEVEVSAAEPTSDWELWVDTVSPPAPRAVRAEVRDPVVEELLERVAVLEAKVDALKPRKGTGRF